MEVAKLYLKEEHVQLMLAEELILEIARVEIYHIISDCCRSLEMVP
jgi:hypothetical protein